MSSGLTAGFVLDQQWHWMRGEMETTKKPALAALARVLDAANVAYAIIAAWRFRFTTPIRARRSTSTSPF